MAPKIGCFGSVLYHNPDSNRCGCCPLLEECKVEVVHNQARLDELLKELSGDSTAPRKVRKAAAQATTMVANPRAAAVPAPVVIPGVGNLKKKPREFVESWTRKGLVFTDAKQGINPFKASGNKFAVVAMDYFLAKRSVTKDELWDLFFAPNAKNESTWMGHGTASSHVSIVFDTFEFLGIITVSGNTGYLVE